MTLADDTGNAWFIRVHRRRRPLKISPTWEYSIHRFAATSPAESELLFSEDSLNFSGRHGWELVTIYRMPRDKGGGWNPEWRDALVFAIYKRRVAKRRSS